MTETDDDNTSGGGLFRQCDPDPKGSVSKSWSMSLLFIIFFFGFAIFEGSYESYVMVFGLFDI